MDERIVQFRVGVMVLATFIIAAILVLLFGELPTGLGQSTYQITVRFASAPGVTPDTPVRKFGLLIGRVTSVGFDEANEGAVVSAAIHGDVVLRENEVCRIKSGLLGDPVLEFVPGDDPALPREPLEDGDIITGRVTSNPLELVTSLQGDLTEAIRAVSVAGTEVGELAGRVNVMLADNENNVGDLLRKTNQTLENLETITSAFNEALQDEQVLADFKEGVASIPALLVDARDTLGEFREVVASAERNLRNVEDFTRPLGQRGEQIIGQAEGTLNRLDQVFAEFVTFGRMLNNGDGTLARLINDPEMYNAVARVVVNVEDATRRLRPILDDFRKFANKISRHPETIGVRGAIRPSSGIN